MWHKTFNKWLISYICILALPIIFSFFLYSIAVNSVHVELQRTHEQGLSQMAIQVENIFDSINDMSQILLNEVDISVLSKQGGDFQVTHYLAMSRVQKVMQSFFLSSSTLNNIYLYFGNSDMILAQNRAYVFGDTRLMSKGTFGMSQDTFYDLANQNHFATIYLADEGGTTRMFYITSNTYLSREKPTITILFELDMQVFQNLLYLPEINTFLLTENGKSIGEQTGVALPEGLADMGNVDSRYVEDVRSFVFFDESSLTKVRYIRLLPRNLYTQTTHQVHLLAWVYFTISFLLGGAAAYWITKRNYDPIKQIVGKIRKAGIGEEEDADALLAIQKSLDHLIKENKELFNRLDRQMVAMRNNLLSKAVKGRQKNLGSLQAEFESLGCSLPYSRFLVTGFDIEDASNLFFERHADVDSNMVDVIFFMIANVAEELVSEHQPCFVAEVDGIQVCLVNLADDDDKREAVDFMSNTAKRICRLLEEKFGVMISAYVSSVHNGAAGIVECYDEVWDLIDQRNWMGASKQVVIFDEYTAKEEGKTAAEAIGYIKTREYQKAICILQQTEPVVSLKHKTQSTDDLLEKICDYIGENYARQSFNICEVSDWFEISSSYLSQIFKRKMGVGTLDYVHGLRITKAKELLRTGIKVKDAAELVGYYDTRPMIRAFKRFENMTPVEFKEKADKG